jgi:phosphoserine phosphatase
MKKIVAVIFDVDGTLTEGVSWTTLTEEMGASKAEHMAIFEAFGKDEISYPKAKRDLLQLWQKTGNANKHFIEAAFARLPIREEAPSVISWLKERGYIICLITGSMNVYASQVAERLGVEHWYANTELIFDASGELIDFTYELDQSPKKLVHFQEFCDQMKVDPVSCLVVGDSDNDIHLFEATGNGVLIGDNLDLEPKAQYVIQDLNELRAILT